MSESLIQRVVRYRHEAEKSKNQLLSGKFAKLKLFFSPTNQKKLYIACAIIETCNRLLNIPSDK